jgi:hypothetical protein
MDSRDSAAFGWGATATVWLLSVVAVAPLVGGHPLAVAAQVVIEASPGAVATFAIETLGALAQPALMVALAVLAVAGAAGIAAFAEGYGTTRRQQRLLVRGVTAVVVLFTAAGFRAAGTGIFWRWTVASALALVPPAFLRVVAGSRRPPVGRRRTLRNVGGALGLAVGGGVAARSVGARSTTVTAPSNESTRKQRSAVIAPSPATNPDRQPQSDDRFGRNGTRNLALVHLGGIDTINGGNIYFTMV